MAIVVKRRGKREKFDERKVYASVYSACIDCDLGEKDSEKLAEKVSRELENSIKGKHEINSTEIFGFVLQKLAHEYEPAAFMYQTHRDLL